MADIPPHLYKGAILEEVVLYLLSKSGYKPVFSHLNDDTLDPASSGLEVRGRGSNHQIDAIADAVYSPPFCNPQRLLVEAKFRSMKTGIDVVRNAAGVLKDVSEYWFPNNSTSHSNFRRRYHYLYAVFSKKEFSPRAQEYAYAQDISILPLARNNYFKPIVSAIDQVEWRSDSDHPSVTNVRNLLRERLFNLLDWDVNHPEMEFDNDDFMSSLNGVIESCRGSISGHITMFNGVIPVFLTSTGALENIIDHSERIQVRIRYDDSSWYVYRAYSDEILFSFDLPTELFNRYEKDGRLSPKSAIRMKEETMSNFVVMLHRENQGAPRLLQFELDSEWVSAVKDQIGE